MATTIPQPRFAIGDRVFYATTTTEQRQHPCPDCLDSRRWATTSPAGTTLAIACPRCSSQFTNSYFPALPSLRFTVHVGRVEVRTVGSTQIDTAPHDGQPIRYMAHETGVGSGVIYGEHQLFATSEDAQAEADRLADERNARDATRQTERMTDATTLRDFTMRDAALEAAKRDVTRAEVELGMCREDLADAQAARSTDHGEPR